MMYGTKSHEKTRINDCVMKILEKSRGYVKNAQVYYMLTKRSFFYNSTKIYIKRLQKRLIMLITRLITYFVDKKMAKNMLITYVNNFPVKKGRKYQNDGFIVQNIQNGL